MKVAILFDRFGPYHIARLEAANKHVQVIPVEVFGETAEYQWDKVESGSLPKRITLFQHKDSSQVGAKELKSNLFQQFDALKPDVVAVNGWFDRSALLALYWCVSRKVPAVLMSESTATDDKRVWWKEWIKRKVVAHFGAALVGGQRHADYLQQLGLPVSRIAFGYDVVDNKYFVQAAQKARNNDQELRKQYGLPQNYFLVVSRFIEKKNLPFIIDAYNQYLQKAKEGAWDLYILGDGPLKTKLLQQVANLGLQQKVHFTGFKQYGELPVYFGLARVFVHASTTEQWGLVVNEAMASGLPVVISQNCGCVPELVHSGVNGFAIDPHDQPSLTDILYNLSSGNCNLDEMARESTRIVSLLDADAFGKGMYQAAQWAKQQKAPKEEISSRLLLNLLVAR